MFVSLEEKLVQVRKSDRNQTRQVQEIICNFIAIKLLLLIVPWTAIYVAVSSVKTHKSL